MILINGMSKDKYLYGVGPEWFENMLEPDALHERIRLARRLVNVIQQSHYSLRDDYRINKLLDAISHNQKKLRGD